jgi:DNA-directed RNA polymerase beta subunit
MSENKHDSISASGVPLRDFEDMDALRSGVYSKVEGAFKSVFPQTYGGVRLELDDVKWSGPEVVSIADQKKAMNSQSFLSRRLKGTFNLYDTESGELLDRKESTLMRAPMITQRGTIIHNGNEYAPISQARLLPGAYGRRKDNGEVEVQVNPRQGTGPAFRVQIEPETGILRLNIRKSNLPLYPLLKDMGYSDDELQRRWGAELLEVNKSKYSNKVFPRAYQKLVRKTEHTDDPEKQREQLKEVFAQLQLHRDSAAVTLPSILERERTNPVRRRNSTASGFKDYGATDDDVVIGMEGLLDITDKVIGINRGIVDPDERDDLIFKKFLPFDELLKDRILLDSGKVRLATVRRLSKQRNLSPLRTNNFDSYVSSLMLGTGLVSTLEETNPFHWIEQQRRFTAMGDGGIPTAQGITAEAQNVMPSQFGFVDPYAGPESERAGVDARFAYGTKLGADGRVYQRFLDRRSKKYVYLSPKDLRGKSLKIPD